MRKLAVAAVIVVLGVGGAVFVQRWRAEASEAAQRRELEIAECATWPLQDRESCEGHVQGDLLVTALETAGGTALLAAREAVAAARQRCRSLDETLDYVRLVEAVRDGTPGLADAKETRSRLHQAFECEDEAARAMIQFNRLRDELAEKQRRLGMRVTDYGIELPLLETPMVAAGVSEDARAIAAVK